MTSAVHAMTARLNALRPQDRRALQIGALSVVLMLGYARVIRPALADLRARREQLDDERNRLAHELALVAAVKEMPRRQDSLATLLKTENLRLIEGDSVAAMANLTTWVAELASKHVVRLTSIEGRAPRTAHGLTTSEVEIRGEGSWRDVLRFVSSIESATKLLDVRNLRVERGARAGPLGGALVTLTATISGYSRSTQ